jgi:ssDNA-binding Zn-finger/Zn-ribbon topoisomerase 1
MVDVKCPSCKSDLEISDYKKDDQDRTAVFCSNKECRYYKDALIGLDRKEIKVFISESLI